MKIQMLSKYFIGYCDVDEETTYNRQKKSFE